MYYHKCSFVQSAALVLLWGGEEEGGDTNRHTISRHTITRQRTRVTDIVQYVTNTKLKWDGHIARMKDDRWTIRSAEWQIKGARSVGRPKRRWRDGIVGQQRPVWTRKQRTEKDGGLWRRATFCNGRTQPRIE